MKRLLLIAILSISLIGQINAQRLDFFVKDLNASGGVTMGPDGNLYVSDFGSMLGAFDSTTNVYKIDIYTREVSVFASGFKGASGACFDSEGNFYQSNPFGHSISKVSKDGVVDHSFVTTGPKTPVGLAVDSKDNLYVCSCGGNSIGIVDNNGNYVDFAKSELFKCPNGLTIDNKGNLYACNFGNGDILKITQDGNVSVFAQLPYLSGGPNPVGNGHLEWTNNKLYVTTIGKREVYSINMDGSINKIIGIPLTFENVAGDVEKASLCKPNGIAASPDGKKLFINVSDAPWTTLPRNLHPAHVMVLSDFE